MAEHLVKNSQEKVLCDACGGKTERLIGRPGGFVFKGSGFFCNDYDTAQRKADELFEENPDMPATDQEK